MAENLIENGIGLNSEFNENRYRYFLPKITEKKIDYLGHARNSFDTQLSSLPREVIYCKKCVISNQRPRIVFDKDGVCSACNYAEYKRNCVNWEKRKEQFEILLDRYRRKDGEWDVIVPCSGGKDSGSLAHRLKYEYGMHPLCITWSPLLYTDIGWNNVMNMSLSGLDSYLYSPNRVLQRRISKLCFVLQGDHFEAFNRGTMGYPIYVALKEGVKLIMYGENAEFEYGGDAENKDLPYDPFENWDRHYAKGVAFDKLIKFGYENGYLTEEDLNDPSLKYYALPPLEEIKKAGIAVHWFAWYHVWIPQENYYYATKSYSFQAMPRRSEATYSKYASLDDLTDPFHYYMSLIKFGIGRATSDAAHEIRDRHLTREEGVALVRRYDQEFPEKYFRYFLMYLDITENEFWDIVNVYRNMSSHLWDKINDEWKLKHTVS